MAHDRKLHGFGRWTLDGAHALSRRSFLGYGTAAAATVALPTAGRHNRLITVLTGCALIVLKDLVPATNCSAEHLFPILWCP